MLKRIKIPEVDIIFDDCLSFIFKAFGSYLVDNNPLKTMFSEILKFSKGLSHLHFVMELMHLNLQASCIIM